MKHESDEQMAQPEGAVQGGTLEVDVGKGLPPAQPERLPLLQPQVQALQGEGLPGGAAGSMIAHGMRFVGNALLRGPCSIAGEIEGNVAQAPGTQVAVIVSETGRVKGDITAQKISVMGQTEGVLDSGAGEVSLHDSARVQGLVRYGRIQVNGADLNATLERVVPPKQG